MGNPNQVPLTPNPHNVINGLRQENIRLREELLKAKTEVNRFQMRDLEHINHLTSLNAENRTLAFVVHALAMNFDLPPAVNASAQQALMQTITRRLNPHFMGRG